MGLVLAVGVVRVVVVSVPVMVVMHVAAVLSVTTFVSGIFGQCVFLQHGDAEMTYTK